MLKPSLKNLERDSLRRGQEGIYSQQKGKYSNEGKEGGDLIEHDQRGGVVNNNYNINAININNYYQQPPSEQANINKNRKLLGLFKK